MTELVGSRSPELAGKMDKATYDADGDGVVDKAAAVPWDGVTGKPGTFTPVSYTHLDDKSGLQSPERNQQDDRQKCCAAERRNV